MSTILLGQPKLIFRDIWGKTAAGTEDAGRNPVKRLLRSLLRFSFWRKLAFRWKNEGWRATDCAAVAEIAFAETIWFCQVSNVFGQIKNKPRFLVRNITFSLVDSIKSKPRQQLHS